MKPIRAGVVPTEEIPQVISRLVQNLSLGRAQIALDQLHQAIREDRGQVLMVVAYEEGSPDLLLAAMIAIHPVSSVSAKESAAATVVHAGPIADLDTIRSTDTFRELQRASDEALARRGAQFVQWASEPDTSSAGNWHRDLGFDPIADLVYLSGDLADLSGDTPGKPSERVELESVDWDDAEKSLFQFAQLVEATYVGTLDCPELADLRSATQSLAGYRNASSFEPAGWFRVYDRVNKASESEAVGCAILSNHSAGQSDGTVELVYMGLIPSARGRGLGGAILASAMEVAGDFGAARMIMAVDERNRPARRLYDRLGFKPILSETVWAKSLEPSSGSPQG